MPDTKTLKLAALWLAGFVLVAVAVAGVGSLVLSMNSGFGTVADLGVTNEGDATRNVTVEAVPENDSLATFSRSVTLEPNRSISYQDPLVDGEAYVLTVSVENGPSGSWRVVGPGGACGIRVTVAGTVTKNELCA